MTLERQRFRNRRQSQGENIATYVSSLRKLSLTCEFGPIEDSILRDQFLEGIFSRRLRRKLYAETQPLSFTRAIEVADIFERTERDLEEFDQKLSCQAVASGAVHSPRSPNPGRQQERQTGALSRTSRGRLRHSWINREDDHEFRQPTSELCMYCGRQPHRRADCPASEKTCFSCGKRGHFSEVCRLRRQNTPRASDKRSTHCLSRRKSTRPPKESGYHRAQVRDIRPDDSPFEDDDTASVFPVRPAW